MKKYRLAAFCMIFIACLYNVSLGQKVLEKINYDSLFSGFSGTFLLSDAKGKLISSYNLELAEVRESPCSTFKILNSLIGLETNVVSGENFLIKWDSVARWLPVWNQDHTLKSAFSNSVVWYYQEVARRIGMEKMKTYIDSCRYGNCNITGGIDEFWLGSSLLISPMEQLVFLKKFYNEELPFKKENIEIVKNIMILSRGDNFIIRGKTGSNSGINNIDTGWFVGYLEIDNSVFIYVTKINGKNASGIKAKGILFNILEKTFPIKIR